MLTAGFERRRPYGVSLPSGELWPAHCPSKEVTWLQDYLTLGNETRNVPLRRFGALTVQEKRGTWAWAVLRRVLSSHLLHLHHLCLTLQSQTSSLYHNAFRMALGVTEEVAQPIKRHVWGWDRPPHPHLPATKCSAQRKTLRGSAKMTCFRSCW